MLNMTIPIDPHVDEQLRTAPIAWLGSVRPDGSPHMAPVWFHWDGNTFLIFNQPHDQKVRNLRHSPNVTLGIPMNPEATSVAILRGIAEFLLSESPEHLPPEYLAKYRRQIDAYGWDATAMAEQYSTPIRIQPTKLVAW